MRFNTSNTSAHVIAVLNRLLCKLWFNFHPLTLVSHLVCVCGNELHLCPWNLMRRAIELSALHQARCQCSSCFILSKKKLKMVLSPRRQLTLFSHLIRQHNQERNKRTSEEKIILSVLLSNTVADCSVGSVSWLSTSCGGDTSNDYKLSKRIFWLNNISNISTIKC